MTTQDLDWTPLHYTLDSRDECGGEWMPGELVPVEMISAVSDFLVLLDVIAPQPESSPRYDFDTRCRTLRAARGGQERD